MCWQTLFVCSFINEKVKESSNEISILKQTIKSKESRNETPSNTVAPLMKQVPRGYIRILLRYVHFVNDEVDKLSSLIVSLLLMTCTYVRFSTFGNVWNQPGTDGRTEGQMDGRMGGRTDGWKDGWTIGQRDGWTDVWLDGRTAGRTDGWRMDGRTDTHDFV